MNSLLAQNNHQRALEYISVGLDIDAKNRLLLYSKAVCLGRLKDYSGSIAIIKELVQAEPKSPNYVASFLEMLLLAGFSKEFRSCFSDHTPVIAQGYGDVLLVYLNALALYRENNLNAMKDVIVSFLDSCKRGKTKYLPNWNFNEVIGLLWNDL